MGPVPGEEFAIRKVRLPRSGSEISPLRTLTAPTARYKGYMLSRLSTVLALALCIIQAAQALPAPVYLAPDIQRTTNNLTPDSSAVLPRDKVFANNDVTADSKSARSVFKIEDLPVDRVLSGRDKVFANNDLTADTKAARVKA